jgi:transcriptional repressor NrdR
MRCPFCAYPEDRVVDSRNIRNGSAIRRRRQCESCAKRFTTYENIEEGTPAIIKKDGRREPYDQNKFKGGILRACEKRPVSVNTIDDFINSVESRLFEGAAVELPSELLGEAVAEFLKGEDPIAYIRFASVYRSFSELHQFIEEIEEFEERKALK